MAKLSCDFRFLLIPAAFVFIYIQVDAEHHCTSQMRLLIDQISMQQEQIVALEEGKRRKEQECAQLKALVQDLEKKGLQRIIDKSQVPVAAVVIMACNRADYLERTVDSVLKYQSSVASKYPLFVSQDGSDPSVRSKALSYNQLTYMQHLDFDPVHTERPGELIAYYKIAHDMEIAPDFFDYFEAAAALLDKDKSIMAVSSWNDNGQKQFVHDPCGLEVTGFELPNGDIVKNAKPIPGTDAALKASNIPGDVRIQYTDQSDFEQIARQFGVFEEWKDGVPRTAYKGVVIFRYQPPKRVFLVGPDSLQQLGIENA
ncbi:Glycosyl transferase, family 13 [Corchorus olitorius]|uniref:Alpha-1,3-mannosyl-glycoprotein 2-beta-N-acetylglucosaminyltransferase n=1 Tax=Corchorus olitorius TaxID=93759 RepID=A0A1R3J3H9_9ROSI|nr:Glycosyl transferase, family 13 [Corchorus olitorius]